MKLKFICAICCIATVATVANAQDKKFIKHLGSFPTARTPVPIAADSAGNLFYATFDRTTSQLWMVENPTSAINSETSPGKHIRTFHEMTVSGRGIQGLQVTSDGSKIFVIGDNGSTANDGKMWRFDRTGTGENTTYTEVTSFYTNTQATNKRKLAGAIISEAGNGLLAVNSLLDMSYYDFTGTPLSASSDVAFKQGNNREVVFNPLNNVIYPLRNGRSTSVSLESIISGVNTTTGGGTRVDNKFLPGADGALNGVPNSHGYYYAEQHQLITVGQVHLLSGGTTAPAQIRVWDITDNGTSLSLAYAIKESDSDAGWQDIRDAVIIGDYMYVTSTNPDSRIHVYGVPPATVSRWPGYESTK